MHALSLHDTAAAVLRAVDEVGALSTDAFLELLGGLGELSRAVDALGATADAELTRRVQIDPEFRRTALGGEVGGRAASELMRDASGLDDDTLHAWRVVGAAIAPRVSLQGEVLPPRHEPLADAVRAGALGARHAAVVARGIDAVADRADADALGALEATVVECAATLTVRQLTRLVRRLPDHLDPDGALLCAHHHHRFDRDGWTLRREHGAPYLIPPPWLDPARAPRLGGRLPAAA